MTNQLPFSTPPNPNPCFYHYQMQSVLNGRESDINKRKSAIHKRLGKHVNKTCNSRRLRLKGNKASSREEQQLEEKALVSLNDLTVELRQAVDQIWVSYL